MNPLRVLIADDDDVFRSALADFIRDHDSMEVVAEAADAGPGADNVINDYRKLAAEILNHPPVLR